MDAIAGKRGHELRLRGMALAQGLTWDRAARDARDRMDMEASRSDDVRQARFAQLTRSHHAVLRGVAMRCCSRDRAAADDLIQDMYERAWRNFASLQDETRVLPWLVTILRNCWIDVCRKRIWVVPMAEVPEQPLSIDELSQWQRITIEDFHRAIDKLPEPYRSVAILHDVDRLSNAEIAQRLAIPYATVATRLHRAHKQLQQLLRGTLEEAVEG
jgi:RNA polymerase sigma-70 factor (ECF subfamily)